MKQRVCAYTHSNMKRIVVLLILGFGCLARVYSTPTRRNEDRRSSPTSNDTIPIEYLEKHDNLKTGVQHSSTWLESTIKTFQQFSGLEKTGILDAATLEKLLTERCGIQDIIRISFTSNQELQKTQHTTSRFKRYTTATEGKEWIWNKNNLTYYFNSYTPDLNRSATRNAIRKAFQLWANVSQLSFTESSSSNADIIIDFVTGKHGDGRQAAFDGEGGNLAHGFLPPNGDIHFDDDETFTMGSEGGINLFILAAHEIGHSLGLVHSNDSSALMYRKIAFWKTYSELPEDDVRGIQYLYGKPDVGRIAGTGDGGNHPPCDSRWDAATYYAPDDVVYAFKGQYVWAINDQGVMEGYPNKTNNIFSGAPSGMQAVVSSGSRTYMFKGKKMWRFYRKQLEAGFPRSKPKGLLAAPDAALQWGGDAKIYIFKGARFHEFFEHDLSVGPSRNIVQHWSGIPIMLDAAFQWRNGKTYFFKYNKYWRFNDGKMAAAKDYPKSRSESWMRCGLPEGQDPPAQ